MISQEEIQELQQEQLQEEVQRQTAQASAQSQQASQVDTGGFFDGLLEVADMGLDLMTSTGGAIVDGGCAVASCVGDVAVGTVEVIGGILGALAD